MSKPSPAWLPKRALAAALVAIFEAAAVAARAPGPLAQLASPGVSAAQISPAHATTIVSNCADSGSGSLRDAVANAGSGDTVDVSHLQCSLISLTTGAILIGENSLTLIGPGRSALAIDATNNAGQAALYHLGGGLVSVSGMTIRGGTKYQTTNDSLGGCIHSNASLSIEDVLVTDCTAKSIDTYASRGGAIFADYNLYIRDSVISDSSAIATGSGYAQGGGVYAASRLYLENSTIRANTASARTKSVGGGAYAHEAAIVGYSTISENSATWMGGLAVVSASGNGGLLMSESTISGNHAYWIGGAYATSATLSSSTISFNTATASSDGMGHSFAAGFHFAGRGVLGMGVLNSILSNNVADAAEFDFGGPPGFLVPADYSVIMASGVPLDGSHTYSDDPELAPLADNGGPTKTHRPAHTSIVIGRGSSTANNDYDQRGPGFARAVGTQDIGAYEVSADIVFIDGFD